jgi:hypothetical protein
VFVRVKLIHSSLITESKPALKADPYMGKPAFKAEPYWSKIKIKIYRYFGIFWLGNFLKNWALFPKTSGHPVCK